MQTIAVRDAGATRTECLCSCEEAVLAAPIPFSLTDAGDCPPLHRPHLTLNVSTFEDAYVLAGPGCDGVVFDAQGRALADTCHFTDFDGARYDLAYLRQNAVEIDTPLARVLDASWRNYYHWTIIGLGRVMLYERFAREPCAPIFYDYATRNTDWWPIGFSADVWTDSLARSGGRHRMLMDDGIYRVKALDVVWQSIDQPPFVTFFPQLYECFRALSPAPAASGGQNVIVERPHNPRIDGRVADALKRLRSYGVYRQAVLETLSFEDQLHLFAATNIVVAPHGAGLANLVYAPAGAKVVELNRRIAGETDLRPWFQFIAAGMGLRYCSFDVDANTCSSPEIYGRLVELALL